MVTVVEIIHRLNRQHDKRISFDLIRRTVKSEVQLATPYDHLTQDLIDRVLIILSLIKSFVTICYNLLLSRKASIGKVY